MYITPFSTKRLMVYIICILGGGVLIFVNNTYFQPAFEWLPILLALSAFSYGLYQFFILIGFINKIEKEEIKVISDEIVKEYKQYMKSDPSKPSEEEKKKKAEAELIQKSLDDAKSTWKDKPYKSMNIYEQFHATLFKRKFFNKWVDFLNFAMNIVVGFIVLNIYLVTPLIYVCFIIGLAILVFVNIKFGRYFLKKIRSLEEEIYSEETVKKFKKITKDF